jgi:pimeloyl-ACP methyl ester carboxylesterase
MNNRLRATLVLSAVGILILLLFTYTQSNKSGFTSLEDYYAQELTWSNCYDNFECTDLAVPIDYTDITVGTFQISVLRFSAQDQANRLGSLVVNPGGPGASGVDYAYNAEYIFSPDITDRYDIVGFDPRGVSESEPIRCFTDAENDANFAGDGKPDNEDEFAVSVADTKAFVKKCLDKNDHLTSFSTANAARDMDILREALGDSKLNYMGKSYGTFMGSLYAKLFPDKIGRVVLDGAVDPSISNFEQTKAQAVSFDGALTSFIKDCITLTSCPLPRDESAARATIIKLFETAAEKPLPLKNPNGDKRVLTESLMLIGSASSLYESVEGWPMLRQAIKEALAGYGDTYLELADSYTGRREDGTYPNNDFDSGAVIDCLDFAEDRSIAEIKSDAKKISLAAPVFGPYLAYGGLSCKYFPQTTPVVIGQTSTTAPIIVIGTTGDPATPYAWAVGLHKLLTNSQLVTLVGEGHTGQGRGNGCIDEAIDAYYLKGTLPTPDLRCQPENN